MKPALKFGPLAALGAALAVLAGLFVASGAGQSADAFTVDLDTSGNTATSLGSVEECREVNPGDTVIIDVTATNIPASTAMIAFAYTLHYDPAAISVTAVDLNFLLASAPGSSVLDAGDPLPDTNGTYIGTGADTGDTNTTAESGSGVLERVTLQVAQGAAPGAYALGLTESAHVDKQNNSHGPDHLVGARLAVGGVTCASLPTPTPPGTSRIWANVDCGAAGVGIEDAQRIAKFLANKSAPTPADCYDIGAPVTVNGTSQSWANVDCGAPGVGIEDAQRIAKFLANKSASTPAGCYDIGAPVTVS
ncbi:MAG TPA: cohesin domain-containing protein [Dehalococcoidia bacterium]|nr:cohesin domain-containing protein [Dehalococcoidia bacterium]